MADLVRKKVMEKAARKKRAHQRLRQKLAGTPERPRLSVFKSAKYVYAQVINDATGQTIVSATSHEPALKGSIEGGAATMAWSKAMATSMPPVMAARARRRHSCRSDTSLRSHARTP